MSRVNFEVQYHAGNPNICRLKGLDIRQLPECEGGAFTLPREQAEYLGSLRAENERLRAGLERAQYALTKSSFSEADAVSEAKRIVRDTLSEAQP